MRSRRKNPLCWKNNKKIFIKQTDGAFMGGTLRSKKSSMQLDTVYFIKRIYSVHIFDWRSQRQWMQRRNCLD